MYCTPINDAFNSIVKAFHPGPIKFRLNGKALYGGPYQQRLGMAERGWRLSGGFRHHEPVFYGGRGSAVGNRACEGSMTNQQRDDRSDWSQESG